MPPRGPYQTLRPLALSQTAQLAIGANTRFFFGPFFARVWCEQLLFTSDPVGTFPWGLQSTWRCQYAPLLTPGAHSRQLEIPRLIQAFAMTGHNPARFPVNQWAPYLPAVLEILIANNDSILRTITAHPMLYTPDQQYTDD